MHDPMTVAFEIKRPWADPPSGKSRWRYRPAWVTIWHVDPERGGSDDSCDWHGHHRKLNAKERAIVEAMWGLETYLDNRPHFPNSPEHKEFQKLKTAVREWQHRSRWRLPVRWHVWHWRITFPPIRDLRRWLFSRCAGCGGRFHHGYSPCTTQWNSDGPRWFGGEAHVYHSECMPSMAKPRAAPPA